MDQRTPNTHKHLEEQIHENLKNITRLSLAPSKRRCDNEDPPPPLPSDSNLSKKKRHDSGASSSSQPPAPQSSAWKKSDTRDTYSSSSKQQSGHHSEQPVEDIPMPDTASLSDLEDTDSDHLLKIKPRIGKKKLSKTDLEGPAYKVAKAFHENNISLNSYEEWSPNCCTDQLIGGPLGQVTIQLQFFFNKDLEYLVSGDKGRRLRVNVSMILVLLMVSLTGGSSANNFTSQDTVPPLIVAKSDLICGFLVLSVSRLMKDTETEVHKFSDGTLQRILDKLDHMVKDFKLYEYNKGMETRIWSEDDRRRSKDFMEVIERRLKIKRIFRSIKSFVG
ncbi:hypothetical protein Tco_1548201 [Tanacetum coccineum]